MANRMIYYGERKYCSECQIGIPKYGNGTYFTWVENELITVQNFPCWVCDVCGKSEWDKKALSNLFLLINTGSDASKNKLQKKIMPEPDAGKRPQRRTLRS